MVLLGIVQALWHGLSLISPALFRVSVFSPDKMSTIASIKANWGGLYGILHFMWLLKQSSPESVFRLAIYCDGLEAVKKVSCPLNWARGAGPQYDLLSAIWRF